jgi:phytanoyl-CoA hydroxylase
MAIKKFSLLDERGIKDYFAQQGYVVLENILNPASIDAVLGAYEVVKHHKSFIYFSQSVHLPLRPELTTEGFMKESMENPAKLVFFPGFSGSVLNCLVDETVSQTLNILSGSPSHTMKVSMFFDLSTGTIEHQDHWYLDSDPPGQMIAAWYALEDIHEEAGCFFVLPGSHKGAVIESIGDSSYPNHDDFVGAIQRIIQENQYKYRSFPLKKGDVLFWHPYLIHGAYDNQNPHYSRKSLTAHFQPSHLKHLYQGQLPTQKTPNPNIQITGPTKGYVWNARLYLNYYLNQLTRKTEAVMDMRRKQYSATSKVP